MIKLEANDEKPSRSDLVQQYDCIKARSKSKEEISYAIPFSGVKQFGRNHKNIYRIEEEEMSDFWKGEKIKLRAVEIDDLEKYFCNGEEIDEKAERTGDRLLFPKSKKS